MPRVKKTTKGTNTVEVSFIGFFLGRSHKLVPLLTKRFPEFGLQSRDSIEMSWINSTVFWADFPLGTPTSVLLNRLKKAPEMFFKNKSDYVKEPIPKAAIETMWQMQLKIGKMAMQWNPYCGRMSEISESLTPFPHRAGNFFMISLRHYLGERNGHREVH
ncbi:hypothetical protein RchiOBHm_Chr5g0017861 [Rosa chinensis]|uniref:Uncharacterized protein n=1 Tax=Rosa chinensis TaxID=74649 RepID=A0A2P6Q6M1_ROSCH|nr:hypothetical protein RchiOBHm_Chr5g0017861 [Rosa chinensis]